MCSYNKLFAVLSARHEYNTLTRTHTLVPTTQTRTHGTTYGAFPHIIFETIACPQFWSTLAQTTHSHTRTQHSPISMLMPGYCVNSRLAARARGRAHNDQSAVRKNAPPRGVGQLSTMPAHPRRCGVATVEPSLPNCSPRQHGRSVNPPLPPTVVGKPENRWLSHRYYINLRARRAVLKCSVDMAFSCRACHFRTTQSL